MVLNQNGVMEHKHETNISFKIVFEEKPNFFLFLQHLRDHEQSCIFIRGEGLWMMTWNFPEIKLYQID